MILKTSTLDKIYDKLALKTKCGLNYSGFMQMESLFEKPEGIGRYLYDMHKTLEKQQDQGKETVKSNEFRLNQIATFIDPTYNIQILINLIENPSGGKFPHISGNYWSIVRCNSGEEDLLISPVSILEQKGNLYFELQGPNRKFTGEVLISGDCLFSLLSSDDKLKQIHVAFKIGLNPNPSVMQGIFSGINSGMLPIAGRELLIREDKIPLPKKKYCKLSFEELKEKGEWGIRLMNYFAEYHKNNLRINNFGSFDWSDLRN